MAKQEEYSIEALKADFPDEEACLSHIFAALHTKKCSCGGEYHIMDGRKQFQCSKCRFQIAPMVGTIFEKSPTSLTLWFHAIFVFCHAKSGISAAEMQRQLGVTYKCAYRILSQIRKALSQGEGKLKGTVETDTAYFGGNMRNSKPNKRAVDFERKTYVIAAIERQGRVRAEVMDGGMGKIKSDRFLRKNVEEGSTLMTDRAPMFDGLPFERKSIHHAYGYALGDVHINTMESFWSHVKRSIKGTFKSVSKQKFQEYLNAFVFHYNNRHSDRQRFSVLLGTLLRPGA